MILHRATDLTLSSGLCGQKEEKADHQTWKHIVVGFMPVNCEACILLEFSADAEYAQSNPSR